MSSTGSKTKKGPSDSQPAKHPSGGKKKKSSTQQNSSPTPSLKSEFHLFFHYDYFMFFRRRRIMTILRNVMEACKDKGYLLPDGQEGEGSGGSQHIVIKRKAFGKWISFTNSDALEFLTGSDFDCLTFSGKKPGEAEERIAKEIHGLKSKVSSSYLGQLTLVLFSANGDFALNEAIRALKAAAQDSSTTKVNIVCVDALYKEKRGGNTTTSTTPVLSDKTLGLQKLVGKDNHWPLNRFWDFDEHDLKDRGYLNFEKLEELGESNPRPCKKGASCDHIMTCSNYHLKAEGDEEKKKKDDAAVDASRRSPTPAGSKKLCHFFGTAAGCRFGEACKNLHVAPEEGCRDEKTNSSSTASGISGVHPPAAENPIASDDEDEEIVLFEPSGDSSSSEETD